MAYDIPRLRRYELSALSSTFRSLAKSPHDDLLFGFRKLRKPEAHKGVQLIGILHHPERNPAFIKDSDGRLIHNRLHQWVLVDEVRGRY